VATYDVGGRDVPDTGDDSARHPADAGQVESVNGEAVVADGVPVLDGAALPHGAKPGTTAPLDHRPALADLYRAEYRNLVRLATLLGGRRDIAEERVQDAFVKLDRSWDRVADERSRPAYLRSIVINLCRSGKRHDEVVGRRRPLPSPGPSPADHLALVAEDQREVLVAVRALPERQRQCMVLRFYEDMTEAEITAALGISAGSVKTHLHRAMQTLAARLGELA
jgi:RNA polymerase sigma-70 factor (sigma-E family)